MQGDAMSDIIGCDVVYLELDVVWLLLFPVPPVAAHGIAA